MHSRLLALAAMLPLTACVEHAPDFYNITDEAPVTDTSAASFPGSSSAPDVTTTEAPAITTATTEAPGDTTTSGEQDTTSGEQENTSPQIFSFTVDPPMVVEPGPVTLMLEVSADVVAVELWHEADLLGTVAPSELPFVFDATSQAACQGSQTFTAVARDAEGLTDSKTAEPELFCQLPAPGSEVYTRYLEGKVSSGGTAVALMADGEIVAAGELDGRMMLWRLDAAGTAIAGWPKTIADWTVTPGLGAYDSKATAVAVDDTGAIIVAGSYENGIASRRYLAKLNDKGTLLSEDAGLVDGEEIMGLAVSSAGDLVAAGSRRTSPLDAPPTYDAVTWGHPVDGDPWSYVFAAPLTDPLPDLDNTRAERARAVLALSDNRFAVVGERDFRDDQKKEYTRAFVLQFSAAGSLLGQWTSDGSKYAHDAAFAATRMDAGFAITGWCRAQNPNAPQQLCIQAFDADALVATYTEPSATQATGFGVATDRENRLVVAGYKTLPGQTDAWIFASSGAGTPLEWQQVLDHGGWDFATALVCEPWGKCTWTGTTTTNGKPTLIVSQRYP